MKTKRRALRIGYSRKIFPRPAFEAIASSRLHPDEIRQVMLAYRLSKYGHRGQQRMDRSRYFDHCKSADLIMMLEFRIFHCLALVCGCMHDLKEDTYILTWDDVERIFGREIYRGLRILTKEQGKDYWWGLETADWWIIMVKLADRLHNIRTTIGRSESFRRRYLKETEHLFFALVEIFARKLPKKYRHLHLPEYIEAELRYACNRIRKSLGMPIIKVPCTAKPAKKGSARVREVRRA